MLKISWLKLQVASQRHNLLNSKLWHLQSFTRIRSSPAAWHAQGSTLRPRKHRSDLPRVPYCLPVFWPFCELFPGAHPLQHEWLPTAVRAHPLDLPTQPFVRERHQPSLEVSFLFAGRAMGPVIAALLFGEGFLCVAHLENVFITGPEFTAGPQSPVLSLVET